MRTRLFGLIAIFAVLTALFVSVGSASAAYVAYENCGGDPANPERCFATVILQEGVDFTRSGWNGNAIDFNNAPGQTDAEFLQAICDATVGHNGGDYDYHALTGFAYFTLFQRTPYVVCGQHPGAEV